MFTSAFSRLHTLKGRLALASLIPIIGFFIFAFVSVHGVQKVLDLLKISNEQVVPTVESLGAMQHSQEGFGRNIWHAIAEPAKSTAALEAAKEDLDHFIKAQQEYDPIPRTPEEDVIYSSVKPLFSDYYKQMQECLALVKTGEEKNIVQAKQILEGHLLDVEDKVEHWLVSVRDIYIKLGKDQEKEADETKAFVIQIIIAAVLVLGATTFVSLYGIAHVSAKKVSTIVESMGEANQKVARALDQLAGTGKNLSQTSVENAASLEETVASLEELSSIVKLNSDNAQQASALSDTSKKAAESGEAQMRHLIHAINEIANSSKKIEEIISVIDDIAFQTNLLALNAAVEAARAGEQGKGFAVVSEAVRTLAQRSASEAKGISTLIKDSVDKIENARKIADSSGSSLFEIVQSVKKVADLNSEIATASAEQRTGLEQISKAMNQLDQASQMSATAAQDVSSRAHDIADLSEGSQSLSLALDEYIRGSGQRDSELTHN